jgi:hypothetical protein
MNIAYGKNLGKFLYCYTVPVVMAPLPDSEATGTCPTSRTVLAGAPLDQRPDSSFTILPIIFRSSSSLLELHVTMSSNRRKKA